MEDRIRTLIASLTLEEKASLCSGEDFWNLQGIEGKVPAVMVTDGPHGLRKQKGDADHVGLNDSAPATCFPTASALASSWDVELLERVGSAIGQEALQEKVGVVLGPGVNMKRSPLCGRNFEYFSEDPLLSGKLGAAFVRGVQGHGVGTSVKHFAANNQESRRMTIDAVIDERTLREIYLAGFEEPVRAAHPMTVMCAYNRVNGVYCSEHRELLTEVLREEWGFTGAVLTDWGAANDRVTGLAAGLDLEMPGNGGVNDRLIVEAVRTGELSVSVLDSAVRRILRIVLSSGAAIEGEHFCDTDAHHALARVAARESAVLLKNDGILPVSPDRRIAVVGRFAKEPRYQGTGSSQIHPRRLDTAWDALRAAASQDAVLTYAPGYDLEREEADELLIRGAVDVAREADVVLLFAGLPGVSESEGFDRDHLELPPAHSELIEAVAAVNPNVVVVLSNGAPVTMPWLDAVPGVLETYLGGQAWGSAAVDLLLGLANPSGKLAETFPRSLDDVPATPNFPGGSATVAYAESVYVGYRYHDSAGIPTLFPFGHGLSYTTYSYDDLDLSVDAERVIARFSITNTGERDGGEVAQLYVRDVESTVFRPEKELKGFAKVFLRAGETRRVEIELDRRAFAFWDTGRHAWTVEGGVFEILVGASSHDIRLRGTIEYASDDVLSEWARSLPTRLPGYYDPDVRRLADLSPQGDFARLLGRPVPPADRDPARPLTRTSSLEEIRRSVVGRVIYGMVMKRAPDTGPDSPRGTRRMMEAVIREMPFRNLRTMSGGAMSLETMDALLEMMNGRPLRGLAALVRSRRRPACRSRTG